MKTLTVILKQHTPLIHFQHDQYGATLRASEVKPKLDKFLLGKLGGNNDYEAGKIEAKKKGWMTGKGEHLALNYKMKIVPMDDVEIWEINEPKKDKDTGKYIRKKGKVQMELYPLFFANMDKDYEKPGECKQFSFVGRLRLELNFTDELESLHDWIKKQKILSRFFFFTNFGTRSSKGFGSFYPSEEDQEFVPFGNENKYLFASKYLFTLKPDKYATNPESRSRCLFDGIELLYKALRGGLNVIGKKKFCFQSFMQLYCEEVLLRDWEKQKIINVLNGLGDNDVDFYDVKDLLGYSKNEEWKARYNTKITKDIAVKDDSGGWRKPTDEEKRNLPQRMKSPVLFKPLYDKTRGCYVIYIRPMPNAVGLPRFVSCQEICISIDGAHNDLFLDFPQKFSIADFLDYVFRRSGLDISKYVEDKYQNHTYYSQLKRIYDEVVKNLKSYPSI